MAKKRRGFDYQRYLASREWSLLREKVRSRSHNRCEHCFNAPQQAVHHLTYERIGDELLTDLMAVCHPCHEWLSGKSELNPLTELFHVSPALEVTGLTPIHYFIPDYYETIRKAGDEQSVEHAFCWEGCVFCSYVHEDWSLYLSDLFVDWDGASGKRRRAQRDRFLNG
jgi:hypothetical protein